MIKQDSAKHLINYNTINKSSLLITIILVWLLSNLLKKIYEETMIDFSIKKHLSIQMIAKCSHYYIIYLLKSIQPYYQSQENLSDLFQLMISCFSIATLDDC